VKGRKVTEKEKNAWQKEKKQKEKTQTSNTLFNQAII